MENQRKSVGVVSLGCDKNRVDTEKMLGVLSRDFDISVQAENADILIINTCAFLESARKEAIEEILMAIDLKRQGKVQKIIVTGCLPQRFLSDIEKELPEVDAFLGVSNYLDITSVIDRIYKGERVLLVEPPKNENCLERKLTTDTHAYLKIADGCSNHCTYCLIPSIRGKYRSYPMESLIEEAKSLGDVNELILVAQDTTKYGEDLTPKTSLVQLIRELSKLKNVKGIRLLYCYPENITDELIHEIAVNAKVIKYIDIPFQHADDKILKRMGRKGTGQEYLDLINKLKQRVYGIAIRSTFIAGFPGEGEQEFDNLVRFIRQAELMNAGFFKYSREKGTPSDLLEGHIRQGEKTKRVKKLYATQAKVVKKIYKNFIGKTFKVKAEGFDNDRLVYYGRAYFNAPEIDGMIYFFSSEEVVNGEYYDVKIIERSGYDLYGERVL